MEALLLPIGHDLGALYAEGTPRRQQVRAGIDVAEPTDTEFTVWARLRVPRRRGRELTGPA